MKRPVVWLFVTLFSGSLHAQNRAFCEMIEQVASPKETRICPDYGQDRKQAKEIRLENGTGGTSRTTRYLLSREMDSLADMMTLVDRIKEKESGL